MTALYVATIGAWLGMAVALSDYEPVQGLCAAGSILFLVVLVMAIFNGFGVMLSIIYVFCATFGFVSAWASVAPINDEHT